MTSGQLEVALAQYRELCAEIAQCSRAQRASLGLALTATAAIGSYGFGAGDRLEVLLVLPFVLSGLALIYLHYAVLATTIGTYIQTELWPSLCSVSASASGEGELQLPSWEGWVAKQRHRRGRLSPAGLLTLLGQGIVFGVPAAGALALTRHLAWAHGPGLGLVVGRGGAGGSRRHGRHCRPVGAVSRRPRQSRGWHRVSL